MKALLIALFVLLPSIVMAAPFLICTAPDSAQQVTAYNIYQDGTLIGHVLAEADGSLKFDLEGITPGAYTFTATAANAWGESPLSDPYISPTSASAPSGVSLVAE